MKKKKRIDHSSIQNLMKNILIKENVNIKLYMLSFLPVVNYISSFAHKINNKHFC